MILCLQRSCRFYKVWGNPIIPQNHCNDFGVFFLGRKEQTMSLNEMVADLLGTLELINLTPQQVDAVRKKVWAIVKKAQGGLNNAI